LHKLFFINSIQTEQYPPCTIPTLNLVLATLEGHMSYPSREYFTLILVSADHHNSHENIKNIYYFQSKHKNHLLFSIKSKLKIQKIRFKEKTNINKFMSGIIQMPRLLHDLIAKTQATNDQ